MRKSLLLFSLVLFMFSCCKTNKTKSISNTGGGNPKFKTDERVYTELEATEYKMSKEEILSKHTSPPPPQDTKEVHARSLKVNFLKNKMTQPKDTNISIGVVFYQVPDTMIVFNKYPVRVRISKEKKVEVITEGLDSKNGEVVASNVAISQKMEVTLKDESPDNDPSFIISQINNDQQIVDNDGYTEWIFNVQPVKHGNKKLNLVISIVKNDAKKQIVYTDNIVVKESIKGEVKTFWEKYWQYIISTFLLPLFYFIWKRFSKKD